MKTYWLRGRETVEDATSTCPFGSLLLEELSKVKGSEEIKNNKNRELVNEADVRSIYSPVSFEDVKRTKDTIGTPNQSPAKHTNFVHVQKMNISNNGYGSCPQSKPLMSVDKDLFIIHNKIQNNNDVEKPSKLFKEEVVQSQTCVIL